MQIVELEARQIQVPLKKPVRHASHTRTSTDNVVVVCRLSDGTLGYGEGVPREYVTGETIDSALALLKRTSWEPISSPCTNFHDAIRLAEQFQLAAVPDDGRQCQGNAARCAVELAILDAFGRAFGEPLMNVTKHLAPELYLPRQTVRYSGIILSAKGWKVRVLSWGMRLLGFEQIKIKVGISGQDDVARIKSIRRRVGASMALRIDANEAWTPEDFVSRCQEFLPFGVQSVEQPVPHEQIHLLSPLRKSGGLPIMLDESLCSMIDAQRAVRGTYADAFNLRLSKCGGFIPSLRLAEFAAKNGLSYQLGCQVGETAILSAAGRQFATSVANLSALEGSYDRHLIRSNVATDDISFRRGGSAPMLTGSGLGIKIDPAKLDAMTIRREKLLG